ncbi:MAG: hypothetical protein J6P03_02215 [Opitutales bacterium]|nr:hypothetical protein [Opitutales bacterium]
MTFSEEIGRPVRLYGFMGTNTEADDKVFAEWSHRPVGIYAYQHELYKTPFHDGAPNARSYFGVNIHSGNTNFEGRLGEEVEILGVGIICENPLPTKPVPLVFKRIAYNLQTGAIGDGEPAVDFVYLGDFAFSEDEIKSYLIGGAVRRFAGVGLDLPESRSEFGSFSEFESSFFYGGFEERGGYLNLNEGALYYDVFDVEENTDKTFDPTLGGGENGRPREPEKPDAEGPEI